MNEATTRLEELLVMGRRVRVRLSPECIPQVSPTCDMALSGDIRHTPENDGRIGTIWRTDYPDLPGHPFEVSFAGGFFLWGHHYARESYAASELIPLNDDGSEILHPLLARYER